MQIQARRDSLPGLIRRLGEGGMGEVWLAEDPARGPVAVKQLHEGVLDAEALEHLRAEFATLSRLRHPNLVEAYDYVVYPSGRHAWTMEYVQGLDFTAATGGLPASGVVGLALQVCEALDHVHAHDLIHGDVKPGNLLVRDGVVKLMDFGLAGRPGPRAARGSL
ncbi:MAG: serine/threonine protein kinase, partial [Planctomycetia bacterium]|nr:serine/threonine protein kinase [Planctomycetia bacterium]